MDRVQRSGLITLVLLLGVAGVGLLLGSLGPAEAKETSPATVTVETDELLRAALVPPQRRRSLTAADFRREPVKHPLRGGAGRDVNLPVEDPPSGEAGSGAIIDLGPPSSSPGGSEAFAGLRRVRVRSNETLQSISARELGTSKRWGEIASLNGIRDPRQLRVGQELRLPPLHAASGGTGGTGGTGGIDVSGGGTAPSPSASTPSEYVVRDGDTASEISQSVYGTSRHWRHILAANDISDPSKLRAGQKLRIPPQP